VKESRAGVKGVRGWACQCQGGPSDGPSVMNREYIYIYILYIRSPGLPITKGSPGQAVQSGRAGPHPDVYKTGPGVLGFNFSRPISIH
jgi:hypothetical protein